jgi:replicative DNA helicase
VVAGEPAFVDPFHGLRIEVDRAHVGVDPVVALDVTHDHVRGTTTVDPTKDPAVLLRNAPGGMTSRDLATVLIGGGDPERADVEKARRHLSRLVERGLATRTDGVAGGAGGGQQTRFYASARHLTSVG